MFVAEDLSSVEKAPTDVCHRPTTETDIGFAIEPVSLNLELDVFAIGKVLELDGRFGRANGEFALDFEIVGAAAGSIAAETLEESQHFVLQCVEFVALYIGDGFSVADREELAFANAHVHTIDGFDVEVVTRERKHSLLHHQGNLLRVIQLGVQRLRTQRRFERVESGSHDECG